MHVLNYLLNNKDKFYFFTDRQFIQKNGRIKTGRFYRHLANNVDSAVRSDFYGRIASNTEIPADDVRNYLLETTDFAKGMQDDINLYITCDRPSNGSFRQKLDPISTNIFRRQNPLELIF